MEKIHDTICVSRQEIEQFINSKNRIIRVLGLFVILLLGVGVFFWIRNFKSSPLVMASDQTSILTDKKVLSNSGDMLLPAYSNVMITDTEHNLQLRNPEDNKTNLVYTITQSSEETLLFEGSEKEAIAYINENRKEYTLIKNENGEQFFKSDDGKATKTRYEFSMEKNKDKTVVKKVLKTLLFYSEGISPGKAVEWKIPLDRIKQEKTADVDMNIDFYDIETGELMQGQIQKVHLTYVRPTSV